MKVLVTGAAGFIGSHLSERLLADGHEVVGLDSFNPYYDRRLKVRNLEAALGQPGYRFVEADLREADLGPILDGIEAIVHEAAMAGLPRSWDNFPEYMSCNVLATQRLVEAARLYGGIKRFVFASTSSVYGRLAACDETALPRPISPYGATKLCAERLALAYQESFGLPVVVLRYFSVYGPRQRPDMAYQIFIERILRGQPITIFGDGSQSRGNTYITDAVDGTVRALERGQVGEVYNIGGGEARDLNWIVRTIEELSGQQAQVSCGPPRTGDQLHTRADIGRAREGLGYDPRTPLREGLARQVEWNLALRQSPGE